MNKPTGKIANLSNRPPVMHGREVALQKAIERQMVMAEENTIKEVLKRYLGREATIEDAKLCSQIISKPWNGTYRLFYDGEELGVIKYIEEPEKFRVEFIPIQKSN